MRPEPDLPDADDHDMAEFAGGVASAFERIYDRHGDDEFAFCLRLLGDGEAAADATQETFMRVVEGSAEYRSDGKFRSWLFTIARRICIDAARRRAAAAAREHAIGDTRFDAGPEVRVVCRDTIAHVLAPLTPDQREVLLLHRYHGFTYREIAAMLGRSEAAIKQLAYRAVLAARAALGATPDGDTRESR